MKHKIKKTALQDSSNQYAAMIKAAVQTADQYTRKMLEHAGVCLDELTFENAAAFKQSMLDQGYELFLHVGGTSERYVLQYNQKDIAQFTKEMIANGIRFSPIEYFPKQELTQ